MRLPRLSPLLLLVLPLQLWAATPPKPTTPPPKSAAPAPKSSTTKPAESTKPSAKPTTSEAKPAAKPAEPKPAPVDPKEIELLHSELDALRMAIGQLREELHPPVPPDPVELAKAEQRATLHAKIADLQAQGAKLDAAVAGGVPESLVAAGRADLVSQIAAAEAELVAVDAPPPPPPPAPVELAAAPPPPPAIPVPTVKVGGVLYGHYGLHLADGTPNDFDLDRAYLTATSAIGSTLSVRLTVDADRIKEQTATLADGSELTLPQDTKTRVYVKYAWLEVKTPVGVKVRAGMIDTPWAPYADKLWGHRYVSRPMSDENGFVSTSDLGVGVFGQHGGGLVDWQAVVINGEGYAKLEIDAGKTIQGRITVDPLAKPANVGLPVSAFLSYGFPGSDESDSTLVYAASVGVDTRPFIGSLEYIGKGEGTLNSGGLSVILMPRIPDVLNVIGRFDYVDPDLALDSGVTMKIIGGVSHDFAPNVSLAATFERVAKAGAPTVDNAVFLRGQAGF